MWCKRYASSSLTPPSFEKIEDNNLIYEKGLLTTRWGKSASLIAACSMLCLYCCRFTYHTSTYAYNIIYIGQLIGDTHLLRWASMYIGLPIQISLNLFELPWGSYVHAAVGEVNIYYAWQLQEISLCFAKKPMWYSGLFAHSSRVWAVAEKKYLKW